jgi:hypothetical protein
LYCSGVLVAPTVILTAGHCVPDDPTQLVVQFGATDEAPVARIGVVSGLPHEQLDLALLWLDRDASDVASPLPIDVDLDFGVGDLAQIAGFGRTETGLLGTKQFAVTRVQRRNAKSFRTFADRRAAPCGGDSGGPALMRNSSAAVVVVGVLSKGTASCADDDTYVATNAARDWLGSNLGDVDEGVPLADCAMVGRAGRCFDDVALFCDGGTVRVDPCGAGTACGFDANADGFRCVPPAQDPCGGLGDLGRCDGEDVLRCPAGEPQRLTCAACGASCQLSVQSGAAFCNGE